MEYVHDFAAFLYASPLERLQREKKFNQEARKKIEEMKNKVYFLRTQKLELDRRLLEMESTIASLKDERKVIESTLEDKKREIKTLTGLNSSNGDPSHVTALQLKMQVDVQSERAKLLTSSTVDSEEENEDGAELQLRSDYSRDSEKSENRSRNVKVNDVKDGNEKELVSTQFDFKRADEVLEEKKIANEMTTSSEEEQHIIGGSGDHQNQESQRYTGLRRGGVKLEKADGSGHRFGFTLRRKHSKGKRRETVRNRRSGDELYSVAKKTESIPAALTSNEKKERIEKNRDDKAESETKKELGSEDQLAVSEKLNQTTETRNGGQGKGEAVKREEQENKPTNTKSNGSEETEHVDERTSMVSIEQNSNEMANTEVLPDAEGAKLDDVEKNARKQVSDEIINQSSDQEVNRKQEMTHNTEAKEHENENAQENDIAQDNDESEAEDSEDPETRIPEIDRDDIKRFSESDPDDEAEETEF